VEVILLGKIRNLGVLGEKVKVKPGYARNFLIPTGKAVYATKDNLAKVEQRRVELEKLAAEKLKEAVARQQRLAALPAVTLTAKAGEEGKLFGSIGTRDIADAITAAGEPVEKSEIRMSEGTLRMLGDYEIVVELESDITATIKLSIIAAK
jgi:large subunit ribosomal protein L9